MKRQIRICVFLSIILIFLVFIFVGMRKTGRLPKKETKSSQINVETETNDAVEISQEFTNYEYFIIEEHGRLTVYETNTDIIFLETAIETELLPEQIQKNLRNGIYFETEKDLFDFLESYSS